jgi:hypothetical protein
LVFDYVSKIRRENLSLLKSNKNGGYLTGRETNGVQKIRTYILCSNVSLANCARYDYVEKHGRSRQATDDNIMQRIRIAC